MKFAIASTEFWYSRGFDTTHWRKSSDGKLALVHLEYAKVLVPDIEASKDVTIYDCPSLQFTELLEGEEWL